MVQETFRNAGLTPKDVDRLAVCNGPGSFTGLRVALAFARSFALPRKIPVLGISSLQALAFQIDPEQELRVLSVMDVRRGEICWAGYDKGEEISAPKTLPINIAKREIGGFGHDAIMGDGAELLGLPPTETTHASAAILGWASQNLSPKNFPPDPLYSRAPDAKLPGGKTP